MKSFDQAFMFPCSKRLQFILRCTFSMLSLPYVSISIIYPDSFYIHTLKCTGCTVSIHASSFWTMLQFSVFVTTRLVYRSKYLIWRTHISCQVSVGTGQWLLLFVRVMLWCWVALTEWMRFCGFQQLPAASSSFQQLLPASSWLLKTFLMLKQQLHTY